MKQHMGSNTARAFMATALLLTLGTLSPTVVSANEATVKAKAHNAAAVKYFNLGEFETAAVEYKKAYDARPMPVFLYNLAQCHQRMDGEKNLKKAIFYFEAYLSNAPDAPRSQIEEEIASVKAQLAAIREAAKKAQETQLPSAATSASAPTAAATAATQPGEQVQQATPALQFKASNTPGYDDKPNTRPDRTPFYKKWWFWTVVGAVVVGAATTATVVATRPEIDNGVMGTMNPGQIQF